MGRKPSIKNPEEHKQAIIEWIANGESLRSYCANTPGAPKPSTVIQWTVEDPAFGEQYARARELGADVIFDALDEVSNEAEMADSAVKIAGLRLKADNIKWKLARMAPKKYSDKQQVEMSGGMNVTLYDGEQAKRMAQLAYATQPKRD